MQKFASIRQFRLIGKISKIGKLLTEMIHFSLITQHVSYSCQFAKKEFNTIFCYDKL